MEVGIFEAKAKLSKLVSLAEHGRETTITRNGKAVARLVPAVRRTGKSPNAEVIVRIERFSRSIKVRGRVDLGALVDAGRRVERSAAEGGRSNRLRHARQIAPLARATRPRPELR